MQTPLPAYKGNKAYVFASYAHADEAGVFAEIRWLQDQGVNLWYDTTGIGAGAEWNDEIARAIKGAECFLYFVTPRSVESEHCRREVSFAQSERRRVIVAHLQETEVPDGLRLSLENRQAIFGWKLGAEQFRQRLLEAISNVQSNTAPHASSPTRHPYLLPAMLATVCVVAAAIAWLRLTSGAPDEAGRLDRDGIVVLPFRDLDGREDTDRVAEAVTLQLISRLSELPHLRVASMTAVEPLMERDLAGPEIARRLDMPLILSGGLQREGKGVETLLELARASDGLVLWSGRLRRNDSDNLLTARAVSGEMAEFIGSVTAHPSAGPASRDAYRAWLNWHFHRANFRSEDEVKWIERVLQLEPEDALARLDAFESYFRMAWDGQDTAWITKAREALQAARRLGVAEDDSRYRDLLGRYLVYLKGDLDSGEPHLRESGSIYYALLLMDSGIPEPTVRLFEAISAQRPASYAPWLALGFARGMSGDLRGALEAFREGLRRVPDHPYLLLNEARALTYLGDYAGASAVASRLEALGNLPAGSMLAIRAGRLQLEGRQGNRESALRGIQQLADEGWNAIAGQLFLELDDPRAAEQFEVAAERPNAGRRFLSSWLHPDPGQMTNPIVRGYLDSLGYTATWREEICGRAIDYAAGIGVTLECLARENTRRS